MAAWRAADPASRLTTCTRGGAKGRSAGGGRQAGAAPGVRGAGSLLLRPRGP